MSDVISADNGLQTLLQQFKAYVHSLSDERLSAFIAGFDWTMPPRPLAPHSLPVVDHLRRPPAPVQTAEAALVAAFAEARDALCWGQTYGVGDFGAAFLERYGWVELFGTRGHFASEAMAGGLLLLGPDVLYPDHHHIAEEIYIPLTSGSRWSRDGGAFYERGAGEIIHHPSGIRHAMQTTDRLLIALYLWRGGPLAQKSVISGQQT